MNVGDFKTLTPDSMAELGSVIIVGCCPSIPHILRRHKNNSTPASGGYSYGSKPKTRSKVNPANGSHGASRLQPGASEKRLEMYGYAYSIERAGSDGTTVAGAGGITKTMHVTQASAPVEDVEKHG
jgi:hypothetical protein